MEWTSYPMPSAEDCIFADISEAMSVSDGEYDGTTPFTNFEPLSDDTFEGTSNSQSSSECNFDDTSSMDSVFQSILDATTMLDGDATFEPTPDYGFNATDGFESASDCTMQATAESWSDNAFDTAATSEPVSTSEPAAYSDTTPAVDCQMDVTTTTFDPTPAPVYMENADEIEKQLQWEAIYQLVNYEWVKQLTPADASKYMTYWILQIEMATDERTGLRACYAAHQAIQIRMKYGKEPERKRMQRISMAVNKFKLQFSLELRFNIGTASWYC
uniref:Dimer_Tnp_hAT domain-containing protein n=1 Tax=Panagrellus redivivus TaxID=6233 RepID=A0A7E4VYC9_PANRE